MSEYQNVKAKDRELRYRSKRDYGVQAGLPYIILPNQKF